jgi:hypothetical protein
MLAVCCPYSLLRVQNKFMTNVHLLLFRPYTAMTCNIYIRKSKRKNDSIVCQNFPLIILFVSRGVSRAAEPLSPLFFSKKIQPPRPMDENLERFFSRRRDIIINTEFLNIFTTQDQFLELV